MTEDDMTKQLSDYLYYHENNPDISIYLGDCSEIMKTLPDNFVDAVITDPPYGIKKAKWDIFKPVVLDEIYRILKEGCALFMWFSQYRIGYLQEEISKRFNLKNIIVEQKKNMVVTTWDREKLQIQWEPIFYAIKGKPARIEITKRKFELHNAVGDVWVTTTPQTNFNGDLKKQHPCQKSVKICEKAIELQSNKNDLILDPFMGSGTTGIACKNLNRKFIGIEISEEYCKIAKNRLQNTGRVML